MADFKRGFRYQITYPDGAKLELLFDSTKKAAVAEAWSAWQAAQGESGKVAGPVMLGFSLAGDERVAAVGGIALYITQKEGPPREPIAVEPVASEPIAVEPVDVFPAAGSGEEVYIIPSKKKEKDKGAKKDKVKGAKKDDAAKKAKKAKKSKPAKEAPPPEEEEDDDDW